MPKTNKTEEELNKLSPEVKGKLVTYLQRNHQLDISTPENQRNNLKNLTPEMVDGFYNAEKARIEAPFTPDERINPALPNHNVYKAAIKPFFDAKENLSNAISVDKAANTQQASPLHDDQERHAQQVKAKIGDYRKKIQEEEAFQTKLADNAKALIERAIYQQNTGLIQSDPWANIFLFLFNLKGKDKFKQLQDELKAYLASLDLPSEKAQALKNELAEVEARFNNEVASQTNVTPLVDPVLDVLIENGHGEAVLSDILVQNGGPAVNPAVPQNIAPPAVPVR